MKGGCRSPREILQGLDSTSARVIAEVLFFIKNPGALSLPVMDASFMHDYAADALMTSDARAMAVLLDAGMPVNLQLTLGMVNFLCYTYFFVLDRVYQNAFS
jgi:hypothetical protein